MIKMKPEYEIEKGLKKAQLGAVKTTAQMKADLYNPGVSYLVSNAQLDTGMAMENKAIKRPRNKEATSRSSK